MLPEREPTWLARARVYLCLLLAGLGFLLIVPWVVAAVLYPSDVWPWVLLILFVLPSLAAFRLGYLLWKERDVHFSRSCVKFSAVGLWLLTLCVLSNLMHQFLPLNWFTTFERKGSVVLAHLLVSVLTFGLPIFVAVQYECAVLRWLQRRSLQLGDEKTMKVGSA